MEDEILERPITYVVKVSRTKTETALIPIVAMTAEEAKIKAWSARFMNNHEWRISGSSEEMHGIVDTRGFANDWQTKCYRKKLEA
jgi:hypothetical protein